MTLTIEGQGGGNLVHQSILMLSDAPSQSLIAQRAGTTSQYADITRSCLSKFAASPVTVLHCIPRSLPNIFFQQLHISIPKSSLKNPLETPSPVSSLASILLPL